MKILFCNKYNFRFSGTEVYLFDLIHMLREAGHATAMFSMQDPRNQPSDFENLFAPHVDFKSPQNGPLRSARLAAHAAYSVSARRQLQRLLREFRPEVAHVRNIYHHLSPSILWEFKKQRIPVVYHLNDFKLLCPNYNFVAHGAVCEQCRGGRFWNAVSSGCYPNGRIAATALAAEAYIQRWLRTYESCVDCFLVPSAFVRDKLIEHGWSRHRIEVLPHFQRVSCAGSFMPSAGAPILYFGRLSAEKGLTDLLAASAKHPQIPLLIAGEGPQREELEQRCRDQKLNHVRFSGHLSGKDLEDSIAQSAFTVFPSLAYETLGKSILESYACGRTVIASDLGSRREFVREGTTGLLFPPGNSNELADAIAYLYASPSLAWKMGRAGQERVLRLHSPELHLKAIEGLYASLAARVPARTFKTYRRTKSIPSDPPEGLRPLRIAFIGGRGVVSKYSGIEAYYEEVGKRLAARGHEVTIYCRSYFTPAIPRYNGMRLVRIPTWRSKHLDTLLHTALSTLHSVTGGYDIVHFHALGPSLFSSIPRRFGTATAVTVQGLDWQRRKWGNLASAVLRLGERAAVRLPNTTMVVSKTLRDYYRVRFGSETNYVANGASVREAKQPRRLAQWGLRSEEYVLFLGRFSPEKNCHLLVEAFEKIDTTAKLVLAGGSNYADEYAQLLLAHASERIRFLGYVCGDELDELLTHAMLFVLPSDLEGLSLALLDAMGAARCVLTSDIPENRELVDGVGFTFRRQDIDDLEKMLRFLIADPEARRASGRLAQHRVRENYDWDKITDQIEAIYRQARGWPAPGKKRPKSSTGGVVNKRDRVA